MALFPWYILSRIANIGTRVSDKRSKRFGGILKWISPSRFVYAKNLHRPSAREYYMHTYDDFSQFLFQVPWERKTCIFGLLSFPHATPFPLPRSHEAEPWHYCRSARKHFARSSSRCERHPSVEKLTSKRDISPVSKVEYLLIDTSIGKRDRVYILLFYTKSIYIHI